MRVHHLSVRVRDLEKCARFYRDVVGLEALEAPREGARWFSLSDGILMLEKEDELSERGERAAGLFVLAFAIEASEREAWETRLREASVPVERRSPYSLYFRDPEGNTLAVSHYVL